MTRLEFSGALKISFTTIVACSVLATSEPAHAQTPKYWNSATTSGNVPLVNGPTISVDLQRWRSRYTLVVDAVVRAANATTGTLIARPTVNGIALDPSPSVATACNGSCFVSARWVLDLDKANVDHPGKFTSDGTAALPLTIELQGLTDNEIAPEIGSLLLTAKLEKNK